MDLRGLALRLCCELGYRRPGLVVRTALSVGHERRWEAGVEMAARDLAGLKLVPTLPVTQSTGSIWNPGTTVRQVRPRGPA